MRRREKREQITAEVRTVTTTERSLVVEVDVVGVEADGRVRLAVGGREHSVAPGEKLTITAELPA